MQEMALKCQRELIDESWQAFLVAVTTSTVRVSMLHRNTYEAVQNQVRHDKKNRR